MHQEQLLDELEYPFRKLAGYFSRQSRGLLEFEDLLQESYAVALDVYRRHQGYGAERLIPLSYRGALYCIRRLWRKDVCPVMHRIDLSEAIPAPAEFELIYLRHFIQESERLLNDFQRELFFQLLYPEPDAYWLSHYNAVRVYPEKPIQRQEFLCLAEMFGVSRRYLEQQFAQLRNTVVPLLGFAN